MRIGNLDVLGDLNAGVWQLCYENLLAAPATSVTISGLNGDVDEEYRLIIMLKGGYAGNSAVNTTFNSDSGANYGVQVLSAQDTTASASRQGSLTNMQFVGWIDYITQNSIYLSDTIIKAKSGKVRTVISKMAEKIATTTVDAIDIAGWSWNNTVDNLTLITITGSQTNTLGIGTHILLFKRTPIGSVATSGIRTGDITVAGTLSAGCMQKIYSTTLAAAATSVTISGLDGDVDTLYELRVRQIGGATQSGSGIQFNADAGTNYGTQTVTGTNTTASAYRETGATIGYTTLTSSGLNEISQITSLIYGKSGNIRPFIVESSTGIATTTVSQVRLLGDVWNSTANITSLTFSSDTSNGLGIGTYIELWALRKHS